MEQSCIAKVNHTIGSWDTEASKVDMVYMNTGKRTEMIIPCSHVIKYPLGTKTITHVASNMNSVPRMPLLPPNVV